MLIKITKIWNSSQIFKTFAKNSFLIAFGTVLGLVNVSLASRRLGLIEYGNYLNIYILAQVILGFSTLGLAELSVKYFYSKYGLNKFLNFILIALIQTLTSSIAVIIFCIYSGTSILLFVPFFLALLLIKFSGIYLRASDKILYSNFVNSVFFNLLIMLILLFFPLNNFKTLVNIFSLITYITLVILLPIIFQNFRKKSLNLPIVNKSIIFDNFSIGLLVIMNGFFTTLDQILVSRFLGLDNLALYKIALTIFLAGSFPHTVINTIAGPKISKLCFRKKYKSLLFFLKKISFIQIILCFSAVSLVFCIIQFSGEIIFNYEAKPEFITYVLFLIASIATSIRGFSTIILIQTNKVPQMFIGQIIYMAILMISFLILFNISKNLNTVYLSFAISHSVFSLWILRKTFKSLKQKIRYAN